MFIKNIKRGGNEMSVLISVITTIISVIVTWKAAKLNTNIKSLSYSIKKYPILDSRFRSNDVRAPLNEIRIMYGERILQNPCLVVVEITNSGNNGIENPPIIIGNTENIEMIPLGVENVPNGYHWEIETEGSYSCKIYISLLNPKEKLKASFFMNKTPKNPLSFSCAMCNLQCHEISGNIEKHGNKTSIYQIPYRLKIGIIITLLIILLQMDSIMNLKDFFESRFHVSRFGFDIYVITIPVLALLLSCLPRKFDKLLAIHLMSHRFLSIALVIGIIILASGLLYLILNNILIKDYQLQLTIAAITIVLYSIVIHVIHLLNSGSSI